MKLTIRFFLFVTLLLLSGLSNTFAVSAQQDFCSRSANAYTLPLNSGFRNIHNAQYENYELKSTTTKKSSYKYFAEETEDETEENDELVPVKKHRTATCNYFTSFYAAESGYYSLATKKRLHRTEQRSSYSSSICILFQTFRI